MSVAINPSVDPDGPRPNFRSGRLLLVPRHDPAAYRVPRITDVEFLLQSLTGRDIAILNALYHYRYLDLGQLLELFFSSRSRSDRRMKWLKDQHLVHQWLALEPPGWRRRDSVFLLSVYGAAVLAGCRGEKPQPIIRQAQEARDRAFHLQHDLEANGFFVDIASASRHRPEEGLYHWVGEDGCRQRYREQGVDLAPDGWGRYLTGTGDVVFLLEWDRATSSPHRLRRKIDVYVRHFFGRAEAELNNVLFVTPNAAREDVVQRAARQVRDQRPRRACCTFWTTSLDHLRRVGVLGPAWLGVGDRATDRVSLPLLPAYPRSAREVPRCVAKRQWWEHRPSAADGP
jgi:hypothetical protein